jgi:hypothetical protein
MVNRVARRILPLACICAAVAVAALPSSAGAKVTIGISDNGVGMFSSPWFQKLHLTTVRNMVFWNVAVLKDKAPLNATRAWLSDAKSDHVAPLISFTGNGNYVPSVAVYTQAVKAFIKDFPQVKLYTAWNEPDWIYRPKLADHPELAAAYYKALVQACHGCTIVAGDVYRPVSGPGGGLKNWVRAYARALAKLHVHAAAWALHPYNDVRTHKPLQLEALESVTSGPIWFDEISGVLTRGHWPYPNQSAAAANRDEQYLFSMPKKFPRIARIYHYQWQGTPAAPWDSGLIGANGTPRPAYYSLLKALH